MRWSPPEQKAQPPSRGDGPLPVRRTQPTSGVIRAWSSARYSSSTVCGRNALRTSGRLKAIRTAPVATARWYVMSVKSKPSTATQAAGSNSSETTPRAYGGGRNRGRQDTRAKLRAMQDVEAVVEELADRDDAGLVVAACWYDVSNDRPNYLMSQFDVQNFLW